MTAFGSAIMRRTTSVLLFGAGNRNRTYDLIITNDALYQLSYSGAGRDFKALQPVGQFKTSVQQDQTKLFGKREHHVFRLAVQFGHFSGAQGL